jgi:hypothetical protein
LVNVTVSNPGLNGEDETASFYLKVEGHAVKENGFLIKWLSSARKGENLVCAAVSALSVNFLKSSILFSGFRIDYKQRDGFLELKASAPVADREALLKFKLLADSYLLGVTDLQVNYPGLIRIKYI